MLYISRQIGPSYGVVDTDDDVEEVVDYSELRHYVVDMGIEVYGCHLLSTGTGLKVTELWQDPKYTTAMQAKANVMYGVDIRIFKDEIAGIFIKPARSPERVVLRLSDFGKVLSFHAWIRADTASLGKRYIFVLDDKISLKENLINLSSPKCVWFDIREVTDASELYKQMVINYASHLQKWPETIIDSDRRMRIWQAVAMLTTNPPESFVKGFRNSVYYDDTCLEVEKICMPKFEYVVNANLDDVINFPPSVEEFSKEQKSMFPYGVALFADCKDYKLLRSRFKGAFKFLRTYSTIQNLYLQMFHRYIKFCAVSGAVQNLYIRLCNNVASWLVNKYSL